MPGMRSLLAMVAGVVVRGSTCPGSFHLGGHGPVTLTNAEYSKAQVLGTGHETQVQLYISDRSYFSDECVEQGYLNTRYSSLMLLGKRFSYTTYLNETGCGCNVALYLVSMAQNTLKTKCGDYYCDANKVCGVNCAEIDIQEANQRAWRSTLHSALDGDGVTGGYGGGDGWAGPRDFLSTDYGPGAKCIDTRLPFEVTTDFPVGPDGILLAMEVTLTQKGKSCPLRMKVGDYAGMAELTKALQAGMTPVASYWKAATMLWMDGEGVDGKGPCSKDTMRCGDFVKFYNFKVERLPKVVPKVPRAPKPTGGQCAGVGRDCRLSQCCESPGMQCYEKNPAWAECKETCLAGYGQVGEDTRWTCKPLGKRRKDTRGTELVPFKLAEEDEPPNGTEVTILYGNKQLRGKVVLEDPRNEMIRAAFNRMHANHTTNGASSMEHSLKNKPNSTTTTTQIPDLHM